MLFDLVPYYKDERMNAASTTGTTGATWSISEFRLCDGSESAVELRDEVESHGWAESDHVGRQYAALFVEQLYSLSESSEAEEECVVVLRGAEGELAGLAVYMPVPRGLLVTNIASTSECPGAGTRIMEHIARRFLQEGRVGSILAQALPRSEGFCRKLGMSESRPVPQASAQTADMGTRDFHWERAAIEAFISRADRDTKERVWA